MYILLPDTAHPVAPLVQVARGARRRGAGGSTSSTCSSAAPARSTCSSPWLHPHSTLVPADAIVPPCASEAQANAAGAPGDVVLAARRGRGRPAQARLPRGRQADRRRRLAAHRDTHAPCNLQPRTWSSPSTARRRRPDGATRRTRTRAAGSHGQAARPPRRAHDHGARQDRPRPRDGRALVGFVPDQSARDQAADQGRDRHQRHRRAVGRARLHARGDAEARPQRPPRPQGGRDRRDGAQRPGGSRSAASSRRRTGCGRPARTSSSCRPARTRGTRGATPGRFASSRSTTSTRRCVLWQRCRGR